MDKEKSYRAMFHGISEVLNHSPENKLVILRTIDELHEKTGFSVSDVASVSKALDERDELLDALWDQIEFLKETAQKYLEQAKELETYHDKINES